MLTPAGRIGAGALAIACLAILVVGASLTPDPSGMGTHEQLGLAPCPWLLAYGWPCPTCGMTTAVSSAARGRIIDAFAAQPAGAVFALGAAAMFWVALHATMTGSLALRTFWRMSERWIGAAIAGVLVAGWAYTLVTHAH